MNKSKICLCLTAPTLSENLDILNAHRQWIDMVELRADFLTSDERLHLRRFPELAGIPSILTIRRAIDGGQFKEGEASRTTLMARGLSFAQHDTRKNFAYIDLEEDFYVPSLLDGALAFGTKVIRSVHNMNGMIENIPAKIEALRTTGYEIPKIACMASSLSDVETMFIESKKLKGDYILIAMGEFGLPTRILPHHFGSLLTFCSPAQHSPLTQTLSHIDPQTLTEVYNFRSLDKNTQIYGITGFPLTKSLSPEIHNRGYRKHGINAVYIPLRAKDIGEVFSFANTTGIKGFSVTTPHKESVLQKLDTMSGDSDDIEACNTAVLWQDLWQGYNTDSAGLQKALQEFTHKKDLRFKKVAIIGGGGAAKAAAHAVHKLHGKACIFNRSIAKAKKIAEYYHFHYASLSIDSLAWLEKYSWLIIQTTSVGMGAIENTSDNDPINFYSFSGHERVYDIVYYPEKTPLLLRAEEAGCIVSNGYSMLKYQAYMQFKLFTGIDYE